MVPAFPLLAAEAHERLDRCDWPRTATLDFPLAFYAERCLRERRARPAPELSLFFADRSCVFVRREPKAAVLACTVPGWLLLSCSRLAFKLLWFP